MSDSGITTDWVVSLGSILGIIVSVTVVAAAAWKIMGYLRGRMTREVVAVKDLTMKNREDFMKVVEQVNSKIDDQTNALSESIKSVISRGHERVEEMKWWMEKIESQVEKNRVELDRGFNEYKEISNKRFDQRISEYQKLLQKFNDLQTEQYKISLELAKLRSIVERNGGTKQDSNNNNNAQSPRP